MEHVRTCPICQVNLDRRKSKGIEVDVCPQCKGLWLDAGEFDPLVGERFRGEPVEGYLANESREADTCRYCGLLQVGSACAKCQRPLAVNCPVDGEAMQVVDFEEMQFDRCPTCRGFWIDGEERQNLSQAARDAQAKRAVPAKNVPDDRQSVVVCQSCGQEELVAHCVKRNGFYYCEVCVVAGEYPEDPTRQSVTGLQAAAMATLAQAKADQARRKHELQTRKEMRDISRFNRGFRGHHHGAEAFMISDAISTAISGIRSLFGGRREKKY